MASATQTPNYGEIVTRADFFRVLVQARAFAAERLAAVPEDGTMAAIEEQLAAMDEWSTEGRSPNEEERARVNISVIAVREYDGVADEQLHQFAEGLHALNAYFEDWPA